MERSDKRRADALDNYWDDVQRNGVQQHAAGVDDLASAMIALLCQRSVTDDVLPAQQRIRQEIVNATKGMEGASGIAAPPKPLDASSIDRGRREYSHWPPSPYGWMAIALAAVLLVTVASVSLLFIRNDPAEPPAISAPSFEPSATPTLLDSAQTLFSITIPAEQLPSVDVAGSGLTYWSVPPDSSTRWEPTCCPGPLLQYVVVGSYTVSFDHDFQLFRADGTVEPILANTNATLGPGDALIAQNDDVMTAANAGTSTLEILQWNLIDDDNGAFSGRPVPGWTMLSRDVDGPELFAVPVEVRVAQVTVPAETRLTPPPGTYFFASTSLRNPAGSPVPGGTYVKLGDGSIANSGSRDVTIYVLTMKQARPPLSIPPLWR